MDYTQYGEQSYILKYFNNKTNGFCVDFGAADGVRYSNTRFLLSELDWTGILIEPNPEAFNSLKELYRDTENTVLNLACFSEEGEMDFYVYGSGAESQVSTLSTDFKERVTRVHGDKFIKQPVKVSVQKMSTILKDSQQIDFISIDCEGVDMEVLKSNDWDRIRPKLVCIEHSMDKRVLLDFMSEQGYRKIHTTIGNTFFEDTKQ